ncbi:MAG: hypothetical protein R6U52_02155 [Kosmotogaceae bacterium]
MKEKKERKKEKNESDEKQRERILKVSVPIENIDAILETYNLKKNRNNRTLFLEILKGALEGIAQEEFLKHGKWDLPDGLKDDRFLIWSDRKNDWIKTKDFDFEEE